MNVTLGIYIHKDNKLQKNNILTYEMFQGGTSSLYAKKINPFLEHVFIKETFL